MVAQSAKKHGADRFGRMPLHYAAADAEVERVRELLAASADINAQDNAGWTPLHFAAHARSKEITSTLLAAGAITDLQDIHGNTAIARAVHASQGEGDVIRLLRDAGADPTTKNKHGMSALDLARAIANYDVARHFADLSHIE